MRCKNHGGLPASISGHDDTRTCDVCEYGRDSFLSGESPTVAIPRDQYDLHKESAEAWARGLQIESCVTFNCNACGMWNRDDSDKIIHAADCKAARILGLKREGAE